MSRDLLLLYASKPSHPVRTSDIKRLTDDHPILQKYFVPTISSKKQFAVFFDAEHTTRFPRFLLGIETGLGISLINTHNQPHSIVQIIADRHCTARSKTISMAT